MSDSLNRGKFGTALSRRRTMSKLSPTQSLACIANDRSYLARVRSRSPRSGLKGRGTSTANSTVLNYIGNFI